MDVNTLKSMALRERALRLSPEWQARFAAAERRPDTDWLECVGELQLRVVREHGLPDAAVHALRTAHLAHPEKAFFRDVPLQVKYNRARNGPLRVGAEVGALPIPLVGMDGRETSLWDFGGFERPLVVIGGSRS